MTRVARGFVSVLVLVKTVVLTEGGASYVDEGVLRGGLTYPRQSVAAMLLLLLLLFLLLVVLLDMW
jgi:hypothetical protein